MKNTIDYSIRHRASVIAVSAALTAMAAAPAIADPMLTIKLFRDSEIMFRDADMSRWADNYVELGAGYNSADSLRFGQFSGLTDKGGFPLAGFNWLARTETNDAQYWQIHGANLGLDSRKLKAEGGVQGLWEASFSFDGLNKSQTESARFLNGDLGTSNLTYTGGAATMANFDPLRLQPFEIKHGRDIYRLGLKGLLGPEWDYKVNYREDRRDGSRLVGMSFSAGGAAILPYQIDDKTQQIEAILAYTTKTAQFQVGYTYSRFENALDAFNVMNPFFTAATNINQRLSLAPDNDYHQLNLNGAYNFSKTTRLSTNFSYGVARQNQRFLPYSANANFVLPRESLDGAVVNTLLDAALTTKPTDKTNLKVAFQYRDNDNQTPTGIFHNPSRDGTTLSNTSNRKNAPMSQREAKLSVEGDYEIADKTTLRAGLEHSDKRYTLADRTDTQTSKFSLELRRAFDADFLGSLGYSYAERRGSAYDKNVFFRETYTATGFVAATGMTNHPSMRQYLWSDYDENKLRATGSWTLSETLSMQAVLDGYQQKMRGPGCGQFSDSFQSSAVGITGGTLSSTCLGRDTAEGGSLGLDLQYQPEENLTTFAFGSFTQTRFKTLGREWTKGNTTGALDTRNFTEDMIARDLTLGLGLKWQPEERWDLGGNYVFNHGVGKVGVTTSSALSEAIPLPDSYSRLHTLQLFAKWDQSKQLSWRFNYVFENLSSEDPFVYQPAKVNPNVLFTGQVAPRYNNHIFGVSAVIKSW
jgi:MtrB/PioB family decaheme-associated outer membrane protein